MFVFVGERRSPKARRMRVTWRDGRLAAKPLFEALRAAGYDPHAQVYVNLFAERGRTRRVIRQALRRITQLAAAGAQIVGLGQAVCHTLTRLGVAHRQLVHPAARGAIRRQERYCQHVCQVLGQGHEPYHSAKESVMTGVRLIFDCDGACLPVNPGGWATWAWVAVDPDGHDITSASGCLGHGPGQTNNVAEYAAVLQALRWAKHQGRGPVLVRTDSQLVVHQVNGAWRIKATPLLPLAHEARALLVDLGGRLEWIPREANTRADALTYQAYLAALRSQSGTSAH